jgi:hypothetical protein
MIFFENHKAVPAQVPKGFLNNIASHLFRELREKSFEFLHEHQSINFKRKVDFKGVKGGLR